MREYDLPTQELAFREQFNNKYEVLNHLIEVRSKQGYCRVDFVKDQGGAYCLTYRRVDWLLNKAWFEVKACWNPFLP